MPPWLPMPCCANLKNPRGLSDSERQAILDWTKAGAPRGYPLPPLQYRGSDDLDLPRIDAILMPDEQFLPPDADDFFQCFPLQLPWDETVYITGFKALPDKRDIIHHIDFHLLSPEQGRLGQGGRHGLPRPRLPLQCRVGADG